MAGDTDAALASLETERANPAAADLDMLSAAEIVRLMNAEDRQATGAVREVLPQIARAVEEIVQRLRTGGRLIYVGAGTSGRLGVLDASECPPTFGTPPEMVVGLIAGGEPALRRAVEEMEDRSQAGAENIRRLEVEADDVVVGLTASGRTPYVLGAIQEARVRGALTIGVTCNRDTSIEPLVEILIAPIVGPEVIAGSTRLKAGTAQKMVLNMLSTGAMVLLGKTYGNLMVDLQATNSKLRQRSIRILRTVTGVSVEEAESHLRTAGGEVKTAIVMILTGMSVEDARSQLEQHQGKVRPIIERSRDAG